MTTYKLADDIKPDSILAGAEQVGEYIGLSETEKLQLRLLTEESIELIKNIIEQYVGEMWFESEAKNVVINIQVMSRDMDEVMRDKLVAASTTGENAAYKGFKGKILSLLDSHYKKGYSQQELDEIYEACGFHSEKDEDGNTYVWNKKPDEGKKRVGVVSDEHSILDKIADKIEIGVLNQKAGIKIYKAF